MNDSHSNLRIKSKLYYYVADVTDVYDGDTITVNLNLGLGVWQHGIRIRLWKINAPEVRGAERERGLQVRDMVRELIMQKSILLRTILDKRGTDRTGKFGRLLGEVLIENERGALINVNDLLLGLGLALPMGEDGSKTRSLQPAGVARAARPIPAVVECPFCGEEREVLTLNEADKSPPSLSPAQDPSTISAGTEAEVVENAGEAIVQQCPNCLDEARPLHELIERF